ncbi:DNA-binding transcriptional regulator, LysR family [Caminicella sporogenes DSM 14501]|uniref:DNA-binding transcriptional regulator, LysR family n=1 Tax=Caminicella sporogenes DSM 14501 TaxID=1121266 RepID=A0A1M6MFA2_9FIRM|nr:selenium metabolism-associated LysR family transcriptional regulator [Caminicella sporogenes]RKD27572.1 LysR family transcriptional regulator [Caminicella sporogenes]SHJ82139.1 DNA-binding transcriptional regulator, LysR family [Caminicella sporogenes DSM 14501]
MDFKQLETFVTLAKLKSFSKAAEKLYLTQPTISNHIQNLEKELKTILVNRTNKNITLTKAGKILYKYAVNILNQRETALFCLNEFKGKIEGVLEISASTIPSQYFLPSILCKFNKIYPDVKYNLNKYSTGEVIEKILNGEIDFGIVGAKKEISQLEYIEIMDDNLIIIAPKCGIYKNLHSIKINDLCKYPIILRENTSGTRKIVEEELAKHNIYIENLNIVACIENTETIKECVKNGLGITFISEKAVSSELHNNLIKKIHVENLTLKRKFFFVYHKNRALSPLAETFKNFVLK